MPNFRISSAQHKRKAPLFKTFWRRFCLAFFLSKAYVRFSTNLKTTNNNIDEHLTGREKGTWWTACQPELDKSVKCKHQLKRYTSHDEDYSISLSAIEITQKKKDVKYTANSLLFFNSVDECKCATLQTLRTEPFPLTFLKALMDFLPHIQLLSHPLHAHYQWNQIKKGILVQVTQSRRHEVWVPPNKAPSPPNWNVKHYK